MAGKGTSADKSPHSVSSGTRIKQQVSFNLMASKQEQKYHLMSEERKDSSLTDGLSKISKSNQNVLSCMSDAEKLS